MAKIINISNTINTFQEDAPFQAVDIKYYINENGCHICKSHAVDKDKYPRVHRRGKDKRMGRYVWATINKQEIPDKMLVMHTCDEPQCINPEHLKLGTHADNMRDRGLKGRTLRGSKNPNALLNEKEAYFIKFESGDIANKELAGMFNVSADTIRDVKKNITWKHVTKDMVHLSQSVA